MAIPGTPSSAQGRIRLPVSLGELEERVRKDSNDAAAHYNVALGYWNAKRFDDVERELTLAITIEPRFAPAHLALGYLPFGRRPKLWEEIYRRNKPDSVVRILAKARQHERHALLIDPLVNLAIIGATRPGKDVRWDAYEDLSDYYDTFYRGYDEIEQGRYEEAYNSFNRLLEMYREQMSRDPARLPEEWLWMRAMAASRVSAKHEIAVTDFRTLLERTVGRERSDTVFNVPLNSNEIRYLIATIHHRAGNLPNAVTGYHEVLEGDIGLYMAHVQLADLFESQRRYPEALEERRRAVNANPDDHSLLLDLGVTLGKSGQFAEAVDVLNQASAASPRDSRPVFWLGLAHLQLSHSAEAKSNFSRFVAMAPSRMAPQITLARQRLAELP